MLTGLIHIRKSRKVSQDEAARVIGVVQSHYRKIENGQVRIDAYRLRALARYFGVMMEELF